MAWAQRSGTRGVVYRRQDIDRHIGEHVDRIEPQGYRAKSDRNMRSRGRKRVKRGAKSEGVTSAREPTEPD